MDLVRLSDFKINLLFDNETDTGATIINFKAPHPCNLRRCIKTVNGYSYFEEVSSKSDCKLSFTAVFQIKDDTDEKTKNNIDKFIKFRNNYQERFTIIDEFGIKYKGYFQGKYEIDSKIEGDIYYIDLEMLCNHDVSGWIRDNEKI